MTFSSRVFVFFTCPLLMAEEVNYRLQPSYITVSVHFLIILRSQRVCFGPKSHKEKPHDEITLWYPPSRCQQPCPAEKGSIS